MTRREQLARLAYPNPAVTWSREGAGFTEFLQVEQSLPLFGTRASLARAGVAATAAAEADRDVRLWQLRAEAAAAVARLSAEQERATSATAQIQAPMAMVIMFGLASSTALNMIVVPVLYARFGRPVPLASATDARGAERVGAAMKEQTS